MWKYTRKTGTQNEVEVDPQEIIRLRLVGEEGPGLTWGEIQSRFGLGPDLKHLRSSPEWVREIQRYVQENKVTGDPEWLYQQMVPNYRTWEYTRRDGRIRQVRFDPQAIIHSRWAHKVPWSAMKDLYGSTCNATNIPELRSSPEWRTEVELYIRRNKVDEEFHYALKWDLIANYREYITE